METEKINLIVNELSSTGYDVLIKDNKIIIINEGFIYETSLKNTLNLLNIEPPIPVNDIISILKTNLIEKRKISEGCYDNIKSKTKEESLEQLMKLLKKDGTK